jgi:energy-coupling factor transport system permease protein
VANRRERRRRWGIELVDLLAAAVTVTLRRGDEMGDAITARGGTGQISAAESKPARRDWIAMAIVVVVCALALTAELTVLGSSSAR